MADGFLRRAGIALTRFFGALGRTEAHRRRTEIAALAKAASEDPKNHRVLLRLADCYVRSGDTERALSAYWHAYEIFRKRQDDQKSAAVLKRVVLLAPYDASARVQLAGALERMQRKREAAIQYAEAGWIHKHRADDRALLGCLERSLALDPYQKQVALELARLRPPPKADPALPRILPFSKEPERAIPTIPTGPTLVPPKPKIPEAPTEAADFLGAATMAFDADPEETAPAERDELPPEALDLEATATYRPHDLENLLEVGFQDETIASEALPLFDEEHRPG